VPKAAGAESASAENLIPSKKIIKDNYKHLKGKSRAWKRTSRAQSILKFCNKNNSF